MSIIRFSGFLGENRAIQPMLLPENVGTQSTNAKPGRGDLRPWKAPLTKTTVPGGRKTIFRMGRDVVSDTNYWLSWPTVVHAVVGGNAADTSERTYYTGDGAPKWTNTTLALASAPYPTASRQLGVPAPTQACALSATSTAAPASTDEITANTSYIRITDNRLAEITTSAPHGFLAGEYVTVWLVWNTGLDSQTFAATLPIVAIPSSVSFTIRGATAGWGNLPAGTPGPGVATVFRTTAAVEPETELRYYTYTFVTDIGEESAPNPSPTAITCELGATVNISNLGSAPSGSHGITRKRIYRTQAGTSGTADFYFLREIASTLTSTTDDNLDLGEVMPSTTWLTPPDDLKWLTGLWNGMMAGISGRAVRFCEAYTYYAWPMAYEVLPMNAQPVALATFGQTLVMLTDGNPSVITGGSPESMDEQPVEFYQACVSPLSAVGMGHGVAWASPDGLAYLGSSGPRMLTDGLMTREDWQALKPETIQGCMYEGRYFGFYNDGTRKAFMLDPANPNGMYFLDFGVDAVHVDALQDALFVLDGVNIKKWDAGDALTVTFKSKVFHQPRPVPAFGCAQVTGSQTVGNPATFKLYVDGVLKHTQSVTSSSPFRLPSGFHGENFQIEVSTTSDIQLVAMAHTMTELSQT